MTRAPIKFHGSLVPERNGLNMTLCIFGAGGHAVSVWDAARTHYDKIVFFAKDGPKTLCGCAVYRNAEGLRYDEAIVAVGDNLTRLRMTRDLSNKGATLATVIHPARM